MRFAAIALGGLALAALAVEPALAAAGQKAAPWRETWDFCWRIGNFLILALLIYKLGKNPMKEFLTDQRANLAQEIDDMEKAKAEAQAELNSVQQKTSNIEAEIADYESSLVQLADRQSQEMMDQAKREADLILERGQSQVAHAVLEARKALAAEMLEEAAEIAAEHLQKAITDKDQQRFVDAFADQLQEAKAV